MLVMDIAPSQEIYSDNDNLTQLNLLTREVIAVQYHTLGSDSLSIHNQVNKYARDALCVLNALGVNRKKLRDLMDHEFDKQPEDIDDAVATLAVSTISLASLLCIDLHSAVRTKLAGIIADRASFANFVVDVTR